MGEQARSPRVALHRETIAAKGAELWINCGKFVRSHFTDAVPKHQRGKKSFLRIYLRLNIVLVTDIVSVLAWYIL